jgi:hypothetical protein
MPFGYDGSAMKRTTFRAAYLCGLMLAVTMQVKGQLTLQCEAPGTAQKPLGSVLIEQGSSAEVSEMSHAPHGAKRTAEHILLVNWTGGSHTFKDKSPYMDGTLDGVLWTYCGYSAAVNFHLISKNDESELTGVLIDERAGTILPGGYSVAFSPDHQSYIAFEQQEGEELATIKLYTYRGVLLWKGYNGFASRDGQSVIYDFDNVRWDSSGMLIAEYRDSHNRTVALVLKQGKDAHWRWASENSK